MSEGDKEEKIKKMGWGQQAGKLSTSFMDVSGIG
jgi:hypothetical protein